MSDNLLYKHFQDKVEKFPKNIAIIDGKTKLSYEDFAKKIQTCCAYLKAHDVKSQDFVVVILPRGHDLLAYMLAIIALGAVYVPIDQELPKERVKNFIDTLKPKKIITESDINIYDKSAEIHPPKTTSNELCYIIHTSGSTGTPKGVMITNGGVHNYLNWFKQYAECQVGESIDFASSHAFDMAITNTLAALLLGLTVVIADDIIKKNPRQYLEFVAFNNINYIKITPSYLQVLLYELNFTKIQLPELKRLIIGGEPLLTKDASAWLEHFPQHAIHNEYGPTEVTVAVTQCRVDINNIGSFKETLIPIGKPGNNMQIKIVDKNLSEVNSGELLVGGAGVAAGYWQMPEITAAKFIVHNGTRFYHTGDICNILADGNLMYEGREDSQIKIRGYRVELAEIESLLAEHAATLHKAVIFYKNQIIVCYKNSTHVNINKLQAVLKQRLPVYMLPTRWVEVNNIPLNHNGKLDNKALQLIFETQHYDNKIRECDNSEFAKHIAMLWQKELDQNNLDVTANFFALGGDSLKAARILTKIHNEYAIDILVHELYEHPILQDFINFIAAKPKSIVSATNNKQQILPLSDFQWMLWMSHKFDKSIKRFNIVERFKYRDNLHLGDLKAKLINIIKQQQIFYYKLGKFSPKQQITSKARFKLIGFDKLQIFESSEADANFQKLLAYDEWQDHNIVISLLGLKHGEYELQIAIPHILTDVISFNIFEANLTPRVQFQEYIAYEQIRYQKNLAEKINFWQNYLQDTELLHLPKDWLDDSNTYSDYIIVPSSTIQNIINYKNSKNVVLSDIITAAVMFAINQILPEENSQTILLNQVISTRFDPKFDNTIGCFLRLDPIKFNLNKKFADDHFISAVQQQSRITANFQEAPAFIKMAPLPRFLKNYNKFVNLFAKIYSKLVKLNDLEFATLKAAMNLRPIKNTNSFFVNINISHNFFTPESNLNQLEQPYYDWIKVDNCLDFSLVRFNNQPHLIVSANLNQNIKQKLSENIVLFLNNLI